MFIVIENVPNMAVAQAKSPIAINGTFANMDSVYNISFPIHRDHRSRKSLLVSMVTQCCAGPANNNAMFVLA